MSGGVKANEYVIDVLVVPSKLEIMLGAAQVRSQKRTVKGTSKSEAVKNAGIK